MGGVPNTFFWLQKYFFGGLQNLVCGICYFLLIFSEGTVVGGGGGVSLALPSSIVGWLTVGCSTEGWFQKPENYENAKNHQNKKEKNCVIAGQNQRYALRPEAFQPLEVGVLQWDTHTDGHTDGHCV